MAARSGLSRNVLPRPVPAALAPTRGRLVVLHGGALHRHQRVDGHALGVRRQRGQLQRQAKTCDGHGGLASAARAEAPDTALSTVLPWACASDHAWCTRPT